MDVEVSTTIYLKQWRIYAGLTQAELGDRMGITGTQISRIESGKRDYDGRFLCSFSNVINKRIDELAHNPERPHERILHIADALARDPDAGTWTAALQQLVRQLPGWTRVVNYPVRSE